MQALHHPRIDLLCLDVTNDSAVQLAIKTIIANEGKIDVVVNNAGTGCYGVWTLGNFTHSHIVDIPQGPTLELPLEQVQAAFDTNVFSVLRVNRAIFPYMAARKQGMFITICSVVAMWYAHHFVSLFHRKLNCLLVAPFLGVAYTLLPSQQYMRSPTRSRWSVGLSTSKSCSLPPVVSSLI
jgi:NAD(P)-dependent dehydrogenase (short-subunit alcohol dehydrogenase family)